MDITVERSADMTATNQVLEPVDSFQKLLQNLSEDYKNSLELKQFLSDWDKAYNARQEKLELFNPKLTATWSQKQKIYFVKTFYHARGHFHNFLWYMGNHAPDKESKDMILQNIAEEFGESKKSHEQLYLRFAEKIGATDISSEFVTQAHHLPFIKSFNVGHLEWLEKRGWNSCLAAFSAYERLDNIDYVNLKRLASSLIQNEEDILFFTVHTYVEHFESTLKQLLDIWKKEPQTIIEAFEFIQEHQSKLWENLSNAIFNLKHY